MTVVEQLDRAARELARDHPINNRLALILVDNATELILHRRCTDRAQAKRFFGRLTPKQRAMARGTSLEAKLKLLEELGELAASERRFIKIAHDYRNEVYHVGLMHDDIIRPIAGHYYGLSCDLFVRLRPSWRASSSYDKFSDIAERYLPVHNGRPAFLGVDNEQLADKLMAALPGEVETLQPALATSAEQAIEEVKSHFEFLVHDNPGKMDGPEILRLAQWQLDFARALEREGVEGFWIDPGYLEDIERIKGALEATWRQRYTSLPLEKWLARAEAIRQEPDPLVALDLHQALRNDMAYLEDAMGNAAAELDAWIQMEIDRARGK